MDPGTLVEGYLRVVGTIYDSTLENYFERCLTLLENLNPIPHIYKPVSKHLLYLSIMGIRRRLTADQLPVFSRYIARVSRELPRLLPLAIRLAAMGYHCEKLTRQQTVLREFKAYLGSELASFNEARWGPDAASAVTDQVRQEAVQRAVARQRAIPDEFRHAGDGILEAMEAFRLALSSEARPAMPVILPVAADTVDFDEAARS